MDLYKNYLENNYQSNADLTALEFERLRVACQDKVIATLDAKMLGQYRDPAVRETVRRVVYSVASAMYPNMADAVRKGVIRRLSEELHGYGPLDEFLDDPEVTEILVYNWHTIDIEKDGKVHSTSAGFQSEQHLRQVVERIVLPAGRRIDESSPIVDCRLPDGSRVHATIPDVAVGGTTVSIRKFKKGVSLDRLVEWKAMPPELAAWLTDCAKKRVNILISGGTGSGKTTLLSSYAARIPDDYVINLIEDPPEIDLSRRRLRRYQTRPPGIEGTGEVPLYSVVVGALRERPDIIIVGECRSKEAFSMLQAMNTGHAGSVTTVHANSAADALDRLVAMAASSGELPKDQVPDYVARALELVVHVSRVAGGARKVVEVAQVEAETVAGRVKVKPLIELSIRDSQSLWRVTGQFTRKTSMSWQGMMPLPLPEGGVWGC